MIWALAASAGLLAYGAVGYPAALAVLRRVRPRPVRLDPAYRPGISLVVAAFNEEAVIGAKLDAVAGLRYPRGLVEVIVAADGSDDLTPEIARAHPGVIVLDDPVRRGKAAALNRAALQASGEILVFTDANNVLDPGCLEALAAHLGDPEVGVVAGAKHILDESGRALDAAEGAYWRYEALIRSLEAGIGSVTGVSGELIAVRREAFRPIREDAILDDWALALQAAARGWRIAYADDARSFEPASATVGDELVRRSRIFTGTWQTLASALPALLVRRPLLAWQIVSHKGLRLVAPFLAIALLVSSGVLATRTGWAWAVLGAQVAFYALALAGWVDARRGHRRRLPFTAYYLVRLNLAALRGFVDFGARRDLSAWKKARRFGEPAPAARRERETVA